MADANCIVCSKPVPEGGFCYHNTPLEPPEAPLRLFCVTQDRELYVLAVDREEAERMARDVDTNDAVLEAYANEVRDDTWRIPEDWLDSEPFGEHRESITVRQWLAKNPLQPPLDPVKQLPGPSLFAEWP